MTWMLRQGGSATLIGDTVAVTAAHNVSWPVLMAIDGYFGSHAKTPGPSSQDGTLQNDEVTNNPSTGVGQSTTGGVDDFVMDGGLPHLSDEEDIFLPERLFQIGISGNAALNDQQEDILHRENRLQRNDNFRRRWAFTRPVDWRTYADSGYDFSWITTEGRIYSEFSGDTDLDRFRVYPSMVSNSFDFKALSEDEITSRSFLTHHQDLHWQNADPEQMRGSLASPGVVEKRQTCSVSAQDCLPQFSCESDRCAIKLDLNCGDDNAVSMGRPAEYDSFVGSSGGAVMDCETETCGAEKENGQTDPKRPARFVVVGVHEAGVGGISDWERSDDWSWSYDPNGGNAPVHSSFAAPVPGNFSKPKSETQVSTCRTSGRDCYNYPSCEAVDQGFDGIRFCDTWAGGELQYNEFYGDPPEDDLLDPDLFEPFEVGATGEKEERDRNIYLHCNRAMRTIVQDERNEEGPIPGVLTGFRGFETMFIDEDRALGTLRGVCAPLDPTPYSENWRHLRLTGSVSAADRTQGPIRRPTFVRWRYRLNDVLATEFYEERGQEGRVLRPFPMKTCPPSTFLKGFKIQRNSDGKVRRISELICESAVIDPNNTTEYVVPTIAPDYGYTLKGNTYSLTQRLGAEPIPVVSDEIACDAPNSFIYKMTATYSPAGQVKALHIGCVSVGN